MEDFDHGFPDNPYNKHAWIAGKPKIGERVWIGAFCLIDALYAPLKIEKGCNISSGVQILTHSTIKRCISEGRYGEIDAVATEIGEFCFIGTNAVVLMGVKIGHHSVIGAGAVIPEGMKIPPYSLVTGVPARIVGTTRKFLKQVENESISITIPAFNEEETIEHVVKEALASVSKITRDYEIVLVDDGSTDKTGNIIDKLAKKNKKIRVVHHHKNKGFTGAMKSSFYGAKKNLVFLAPADGQFDFKELSKFIDAIRGYDVAVGYRTVNKENLIRKFNSKGFHILCKIFFGINFKEISTVSLWRARVIKSIDIISEDRSAMFMAEIVVKAIKKKYKFIEVPIHWYSRKKGKAKGAGVKTIYKTFLGMVNLWLKLNLANK